MHYISTRDADHAVTLSAGHRARHRAGRRLYVPEAFPHFTTRQFEADAELPQIGARLLAPFADGDPLAAELPAICNEAFDFPAPLVPSAECAGAAVGARAVSRPDLRLQGFRRALPRRVPGAHPPRRSSAS